MQEDAGAALPTQAVIRNSILLENLRQRLLRAEKDDGRLDADQAEFPRERRCKALGSTE